MDNHLSLGGISVSISEPSKTSLVYLQDSPTRLGRIALAGYIEDGLVILPSSRMRVYGSYAVTVIRRGEGYYTDANGFNAAVFAGDMILVSPDLPHLYGPSKGTRWDEFFLVFDGPVFDLWRSAGLFDMSHPVISVRRLDDWIPRLEALARLPKAIGAPEDIQRLLSLLALLSEVCTNPRQLQSAEPLWLRRSKGLLEQDMRCERSVEEVARDVGSHYDTFRKRFKDLVGVSPHHYREARRIKAAQDLLRYTQLSHREIAEQLGFADEFYFSKRFRLLCSMTPRAFRQASLR